MIRHTLKLRHIERRAMRTLVEAKADIAQITAALSSVASELDKLQDPLSEELSNIVSDIVGSIQRGDNVREALTAARNLVNTMDTISTTISAAASENQEAFKDALDAGGTLIDAYTNIASSRKGPDEELGDDDTKAVNDAAQKVATNIHSTIVSALQGFSNVADVAPADILEVPLLSFDRIVTIADELDRVDFESAIKASEEEVPAEKRSDGTKQATETSASDDVLHGVARKVALLWKAEGDELRFARRLIDAGIDPDKLEKLTIK